MSIKTDNSAVDSAEKSNKKTTVNLDYAGTTDQGRMMVVLTFAEEGFGFGEITFSKSDGKLYCNSECMSKETVKRMLAAFVDSAVFEHEPKTLAELVAYDKAMGVIGRGGLPAHIKLQPGEVLPDYIEKGSE